MSSKFLVCDRCGVAYDVGAIECREKGCLEAEIARLAKSEIQAAKPARKKYNYSKSTPPHVSRWIGVVTRSKKKDLVCDLTQEDIKYIIESPCVYCGSTNRIEVDRMDSSMGYTKMNTVPACHRCNTIKNNVVTYEEMMTIVDILGWRNEL